MGHAEPKFRYRHALPEENRSDDDVRVILSLHWRVGRQGSWSRQYEDHLKSNKVRSNESLRKRILSMLTMIAQHGEDYYNKNKEYMRDVDDGLWELKPKDHRVLMFMDNVGSFNVPCWLITDLFKKPKEKKQNTIIESSKEVMGTYYTWKKTV